MSDVTQFITRMRERMHQLASDLPASVGVGRRQVPPLNGKGVYLVGSDAFRQACAILEDGTVLLVKEYNTAELATELEALRARYDLPPETSRRPASLGELDALYGAVNTGGHELTPGQKRLRDLIEEAAALRTSDIKITAHKAHAIIRLKLGAGEFTHGPQWQVKEAEEAISWIYSQRDGGDDRPTIIEGEPAAFSVGQGEKLDLPGTLVALRGQLAWHGDVRHFLTLRLIYSEEGAHFGNLEALGLEEDVLEALAEERRADDGLVIIGGSTGDGKSTTLIRQAERLYDERDGMVSVYTMEDPVEYPARGDGIVQFPVGGGDTPEARRANFTRMLLVFVRINPDKGMVSEIRSSDDVCEILQFVESGHKIFTTVHSRSANTVLFRLISLGVDPRELSGPGTVSLVLRQKLVPVLCRDCATPLTGAARQRVLDWLTEDDIDTWPDGPAEPLRLLRRNPDGCGTCLTPYARLPAAARETARKALGGYAGRRATAEYIKLDNTYRAFVQNRDSLGADCHWRKPKEEGGLGGIPLETRLRRLVAAGITDYEWVRNERLPEETEAGASS